MKQLASVRDVLLFETELGTLVSAVDSCGSIGNLPGDALQVDPVTVGLYTARVALLEVLAVGAAPAWATLSISCGPKTAEYLIAGAKKVLGNLPLAVSTEKNMPASMTGLGVTVTGFCPPGSLKVACAQSGDALYCAGVPLVGSETIQKDAPLFDACHLAALLQNTHVHALIPVGSTGIAAEAGVLAAESGLSCNLDASCGLDLKRSAGPATCAVFAAASGASFDIGLPVTQIGVLVKGNQISI